MKKFFTAIVAFMMAAPTFAQYSSGGFELDKDNLYYGVRIGMTVPNLSGDIDSKSKVGMALAGVIGMRVSSTTPLFLESGLYYSERGAKNIGYSNLEIPLLIKYGIKATDNIAVLPFIGPYFARACWGKTKIEDASGNSKKVGSFDEKEWTGLNRLNMGFKLGCGFEYDMLYLEVGYQLGVTNISNHSIHSNALFASFGVNF